MKHFSTYTFWVTESQKFYWVYWRWWVVQGSRFLLDMRAGAEPWVEGRSVFEWACSGARTPQTTPPLPFSRDLHPLSCLCHVTIMWSLLAVLLVLSNGGTNWLLYIMCASVTERCHVTFICSSPCREKSQGVAEKDQKCNKEVIHSEPV